MKVTKYCKTCGTSFISYDSGDRVFHVCCSVKCAAEQRKGEKIEREIRKCPMCPNEFRILKKLIKTYCSKKCQHKSLIKLDYLTDEQKNNILRQKYEKLVVKKEGCWDWNGPTQKGYGSFLFMRKSIRAHRVSWMLFNGEIPEEKHVLHKCDNKICSNPQHLFLGSHADNMRDMREKGLHRQYSKLTANQVKDIKYLLNQGEKIENISGKYSVSVPTIYDIKDGRTWRSVTLI